MNFNIDTLNLDEQGLIPAIIQNAVTLKILMMGYMNIEAINKTMNTGTVWFYSRSRQSLWNKGETSGNFLKTVKISVDCDSDCLLVQALPLGPTCHTNHESCFFTDIFQNQDNQTASLEMLIELYHVIQNRKANPKEGAYTTYLFDKGIDKILKKVGEEAAEVIIAAKNNNPEEIIYETSDLIYHTMVMLCDREVGPNLVLEELKKRFHK
jgi:phosphoribosyl-ATP pyrophosphohydrolase/phosphoribosyl-AMP cyclohydrolase